MMMWSYLLMTAGCCYLYDDHFMSINANMISYQLLLWCAQSGHNLSFVTISERKDGFPNKRNNGFLDWKECFLG